MSFVGRSVRPFLFGGEFMQDWLAARAQATPNQKAIIFKEQVVTYSELDILVHRMCMHLLFQVTHIIMIMAK